MRNLATTLIAAFCMFGVLGDGSGRPDAETRSEMRSDGRTIPRRLRAKVETTVPTTTAPATEAGEAGEVEEREANIEAAKRNDPAFRSLMNDSPNLGGLHSDTLQLFPPSVPKEPKEPEEQPVQSVPSARQAVREAIPPRGENTWVKATASDVPGPAERDETIRATHFDNFLRMELGRLDRTIWNVVHNIAHRDTFGYKAFRFEFPEALPRFSADSERITLPESAGEVPALVDMSRGKTVETKQMLDIVIEGEGFLTANDSRSGDSIYTRCGRLTVDPNGCLAFSTPWLSLNADWYSEPLDPSVAVPEGTVSIQIAQRGTVWAKDASGNQTDCGMIHIVTFAKPHRLRPIDERFFEATRDSGEPVTLDIDDKDFPVIRQGFLEASNVDPDAQKSELRRLLEQRDSLRKLIAP